MEIADTRYTLSRNKHDYTERYEHVKTTFEKAKIYVRPNNLSRLFLRIYTERKLVVIALIHICVTTITWSKFSMLKNSLLHYC